MQPVNITHLAKRFGDVRAVQDVSFEVEAGEIFGLLGPNGAGKTTTIRMMLDIFRPDAGSVSIFGGPLDLAGKRRIGYLPEERGLYKDQKLEPVLIYLAALKGLPEKEARAARSLAGSAGPARASQQEGAGVEQGHATKSPVDRDAAA